LSPSGLEPKRHEPAMRTSTRSNSLNGARRTVGVAQCTQRIGVRETSIINPKCTTRHTCIAAVELDVADVGCERGDDVC
jgi:hypothetical protein